MSATIFNLPRAAAKEDPWQALGLTPFRESHPLWKRTQPSLAEHIDAAMDEFPMLGYCEVIQRRSLITLENSPWTVADSHEELLQAVIGLSRRFLRMRNALQGKRYGSR